MSHPRHEILLQTARTDGRVEVEPMAQALGVTVQTIRRDLAELCDAGLLARVHGGAVLASGVRNIAYRDRQTTNAAAKDAIARACVADIADGSSLFLGIGTTTEAIARALSARRNLLILTNNLNIATLLTGHDSAEVIVTGGHLRAADGGLVGSDAAAAVGRYKTDLAIMGISALEPDGDLMDYDAQEVMVSQAARAATRQAVLVADAGKTTRQAPVRMGHITQMQAIYTDRPLRPDLEAACAAAGVRVVVPA